MPSDPSEIHRKALRAASAVAFGFSACADPVSAVQGAPAATGDAAKETAVSSDGHTTVSQSADAGVPDAAGADLPPFDAPPNDAAKADSAPEVATASDTAAETVPPKDAGADVLAVADGGGKPDCTKAQQSGNWMQCCDELRVWCDAAFGAGSQASNECAFGKNFDSSTGCTPWGPPAPPPWPGAVA